MDSKTILVKNWIIKAKHDLFAAKKIGEEEEYLDVAIYHCQQAAEKALKGFLTLHDLAFSKTHDIRLLVQLATKANPEFHNFEDTADFLTPYATEFRYPGEIMNPSKGEFLEALTKAEEILKFIINLLPSGIIEKL